MHRAVHAYFVTAMLVGSSCARSQPPMPSAMTPPTSVTPRVTSASREPLRVSWARIDDAASAEGTESARILTLVTRVEYRAGLAAPQQVSLRLPSGLRLLQGAVRATLPPAAEGEIRELAFTFQYGRAPADDLVLVLDCQQQSQGVHAELAYRFGRPEPRGPMSAATGPALVVGGVDYGRSIDMGAR